MKTEFLLKSQENLKAAELLLANQLYNASANRAYYAVFQAAIAALAKIGLESEHQNHHRIQSNFVAELIQKRKVYPGHLKSSLMELQDVRNDADYNVQLISQKVAVRQLKRAQELVAAIVKELQS